MSKHTLHNHNAVTDMVHKIEALGYQSVLVAGGAIRDHYFGITPADIDIFVTDSDYSSDVVVKMPTPAWQAYLDLDSTTDRVNFWGNNYSGLKISGVIDIHKNGIKFQIIKLMIHPEDYIRNHFSINISKCWYEKGTLTYTDEFYRDVENSTLTVNLTNDEKHNDTVRNHYVPKIMQKFPSYSPIFA